MISVVQDWLRECSFKQQTVLLTAIRGCDGLPKGHTIKKVVRSYRSIILKNADTSTTFMKFRLEEDDIKNFTSNIDHLPIHYITHFMHGCEIVGYYHPDLEIRYYWKELYFGLCNALHLNPETKKENAWRLRDNL